MKTALRVTLLACVIGAAIPALADVKAGVDAWAQGDYARAVNEWRMDADAGNADAQFNMGQAYKFGRGVPADLTVAAQWFGKAAAQGHVRAADNYGLILFQQGRRAEAMPYIRKSSDHGEPRAQYILGTAMFNGDGVPKDWITAYALMTRASATGLSQASNSLSLMDQYIPDDQRKKGLAMAAALARSQAASDGGGVTFAPTIDAQSPAAPRRVAVVPVVPKPVAEKAAPAPKPVAEPAPVPVVAEAKPKPQPVAKPKALPVEVAAAKPKPPVEAPAAALPKVAASGGWRVQLGAFRDEPRAKTLWDGVKGRVSGMSAYQSYFVRGGDVTRLQAGPLHSEADAGKLCGRLKASGYDCMVKEM